MKTLRNIADYVKAKVKVNEIGLQDYVSTDSMLPNKDGISSPLTIPSSGNVTHYQAGDILVSNIRPYFKKIWYATKDGGCSNDVLVFRVIDGDETDSQYLYYLLSQDSFFDHMMAGANGAKMPRGNKKLIPDFVVPDFDLPYQRKIASLLASYDELIEVNRKQIRLLEEAARRIYEEWFVDFRFPGYEKVSVKDGIPNGWSKKSIGDVIAYEIGGGWGNDSKDGDFTNPAYVIRGTDFHSVTDGTIKEVPLRYHTDSNLRSRTLQDGDIIFEVSGGSKTEGAARTVYITDTLLEQLDAPAICASFCKLVRSKDRKFAKYLFDTFQYLRRKDETRKYDKYSAGNIVNYRWADFLAQQKIIIPKEDIVERYSAIVENMYHQVQNLARQISEAQVGRNLLLPRLMSGEVKL